MAANSRKRVLTLSLAPCLMLFACGGGGVEAGESSADPASTSEGETEAPVDEWGVRMNPKDPRKRLNLPWNLDPDAVRTPEDVQALEPIPTVGLAPQMAYLSTGVLKGIDPSFKLDPGTHLRRIFTAGPSADIVLDLNMMNSNFFEMTEFEGWDGTGSRYFMSVHLKRRGTLGLWRYKSIGALAKAFDNDWDTANHAMHKCLVAVHEWVLEQLATPDGAIPPLKQPKPVGG